MDRQSLQGPLLPQTNTYTLDIKAKLCSDIELTRHERMLLKSVFVIGLGGFVVGYNIGIVAGGFYEVRTYLYSMIFYV